MALQKDHWLFAEGIIAGFSLLFILENMLGHRIHITRSSALHQAVDPTLGGGAGSCNDGAPNCSCTAAVGGNSPGWYTPGANTASGSGWGGSPGHHHCDWTKQCCFCTDVAKCIKSGTPPTKKGSCRPDWGTSGYVDKGGKYPANADFSKCPPGTQPPGDNT